MQYEFISSEVADGIATLTLNRPDKRNMVTFRMADELRHALAVADRDDAVRVVILTGAGDYFCSGVEFSGTSGMDPNSASYRPFQGRSRDPGGLLTMQMYESRKFIIVAFNGPAIGFGVSVSLPADLRLAVDDARFAIPFVRRGFVPESCQSWFLPRIVGISRAIEWAASGRFFGAAEAHEAGLVRELLPRADLMPRARAIAREIVDSTAPVAVAVVRAMMWQLLSCDIHEAHRLDTQALIAMARTADTREGFSAFLEKRTAQFPLRVSTDMPAFYPWWKPREEEIGTAPLEATPRAYWPD
ncbi:MAG: enoyl-CoA hydratase-related protein [Gammaproteobacteria bacterium]